MHPNPQSPTPQSEKAEALSKILSQILSKTLPALSTVEREQPQAAERLVTEQGGPPSGERGERPNAVVLDRPKAKGGSPLPVEQEERKASEHTQTPNTTHQTLPVTP